MGGEGGEGLLNECSPGDIFLSKIETMNEGEQKKKKKKVTECWSACP